MLDQAWGVMVPLLLALKGGAVVVACGDANGGGAENRAVDDPDPAAVAAGGDGWPLKPVIPCSCCPKSRPALCTPSASC
jgi:hypothetical protein